MAGPGGARSVVAESILLKQQLLILNRTRKRGTESPPLGSRRCWRVYASHAPESPGPVRDCREACHALTLTSRAEDAEIPSAVLAHRSEEAGPEGTEPLCGGRHRR